MAYLVRAMQQCYSGSVMRLPQRPMSAATLAEKGQIIIPAEIRARDKLIPGTQAKFVDAGGAIRLLVRRRNPAARPSRSCSACRTAKLSVGKR